MFIHIKVQAFGKNVNQLFLGVGTENLLNLKEYSVILTTFFMTWIKRYSEKKLISKISVDSNFPFASHTIMRTNTAPYNTVLN